MARPKPPENFEPGKFGKKRRPEGPENFVDPWDNQRVRSRSSKEQFLGANELATSQQAALDAAVILPPSMQLDIFTSIENALEQAYRSTVPGDQDLSNYKNFMSGAQFSRERREMVQKVRATPLRFPYGKEYNPDPVKTFQPTPSTDLGVVQSENYSAKAKALTMGASLIRSAATMGDLMDAAHFSLIPEVARLTGKTIGSELSGGASPLGSEDTFMEGLTGVQSLFTDIYRTNEQGFETDVNRVAGLRAVGQIKHAGRQLQGSPSEISMGNYGLESMTGASMTELDPTETFMLRAIGEEGNESLAMTGLYSQTGRVFTSRGKLSQFRELDQSVPKNWKPVVATPDDINRLYGMMPDNLSQRTGDQNLDTLVNYLQAGAREEAQLVSRRMYDPVMYAMSPQELSYQKREQAIRRAPEIVNTGLWYDYDQSPANVASDMVGIDPARVYSKKAPWTSQLSLTRQELQQWASFKPSKYSLPGERLLHLEARRIVDDYMQPGFTSNPFEGVVSPEEAEDYARTNAKPIGTSGKPEEVFVPMKSNANAEQSGYYTRYNEAPPREPAANSFAGIVYPSKSGPVSIPDSGASERDDPFVPGVDIPDRHLLTQVAQSAAYESELEISQRVYDTIAGVNPGQRQLIDNILKPRAMGGTGKPGKYRDDLSKADLAENRRIYNAGKDVSSTATREQRQLDEQRDDEIGSRALEDMEAPPNFIDETFATSQTVIHNLTSAPSRRLSPTAVPANALSEAEAFAKNGGGRGVAKRNGLSYIRAPQGGFINVDELLKKSNPLQRIGDTRIGAALHETGHHLFRALRSTNQAAAEQFDRLYGKVDAQQSLTAEWYARGQGDLATSSEEFAQAYAVMGALGEDALASTYPEYAQFFKENQDTLSSLEKDLPPVIDYSENTAWQVAAQNQETVATSQKFEGELVSGTTSPVYRLSKAQLAHDQEVVARYKQSGLRINQLSPEDQEVVYRATRTDREGKYFPIVPSDDQPAERAALPPLSKEAMYERRAYFADAAENARKSGNALSWLTMSAAVDQMGGNPGAMSPVKVPHTESEAPFYAYGRTGDQLANLNKSFAHFSPEIQSSIKTLMTEFPEYIQQHLGKNKSNKENFNRWVRSLPEDQRSKFLSAWEPVADLSMQGGAAPTTFMRVAAGIPKEKDAIIAPNVEQEIVTTGSFAAKAQQMEWAGTVSGGKVYINPNRRLIDHRTLSPRGAQDPGLFVKRLATDTTAVIPHEQGHLRYADLTPEQVKEFAAIYDEYKEQGVDMASGLDDGGIEEEFAHQNMLFSMGGLKTGAWKDFQKKVYGKFADFFEKIKDSPAMRKSYGVAYAKPGEFGAMSVPLPPDENSDDFYRYISQHEFEMMPEGIDVPENGTPMMITNATKKKLRDIGYTPAEIREMTPKEAIDNLNAGLKPNARTREALNAKIKDVYSTKPGFISQMPTSTPEQTADRDAALKWWHGDKSETFENTQKRQSDFYTRQEDAFKSGSYSVSGEQFDNMMSSGELKAAQAYAEARHKTMSANPQPDGSYTLKYEPNFRSAQTADVAASIVNGPTSDRPYSELLQDNATLSKAAQLNLFGSKAQVSRADLPSGGKGPVKQVQFVDQNDEVVFSGEDVSQGVQAFRLAAAEVNTNNLPDNPADVAKTMKQRLKVAASKYIEEIAGQLEDSNGQPASPDEMAAFKQKLASFVSGYAGKVVDQSIEQRTGARPMYDSNRAMRLKNAEMIDEWAQKSPALKDYIQSRYGGSTQAAASGPATTITEQDGVYKGIGFSIGQGGYGDPPFGGGGAGSGRPPGRFESMFSGPLGKALYGAYIAKRFWSMTMAPELMAAERYGESMLATEGVAAAGGAGGDLATSDAGWAMRKSRTESYFAKGAYQQWGGFSNVAYSMTGGSEGLARLKSGLMGGLAVTSAGFAGASTIAMMTGAPMLAAATAVAPFAIAGGAAVAGTAAALEAYNQIAKPTKPASIGGLWEQRVSRQYQTIGGAMKLFNAAFGTDLSLTDRQKAFIESVEEGPSQAFLDTEKALGVAEEKTGEKKEQLAPTWRALARGTGGASNKIEFTDRIAQSIKDSGMTSGEWSSEFFQYAGGMGAIPGTGLYTQMLSQWSAPGMTEFGRQQMMFQGQTVARYGGAISGYTNTPGLAQALVKEYGINTQTEAQSMQNLLAVGGIGGMQAETILGYRQNASGDLLPYTFGQWSGEAVSRLGRAGESVVSGMAGDIGMAGGNVTSALSQAETAFKALGVQGARRAQSINSQLLAAGVGTDQSIAMSQNIVGLGLQREQLSMSLGGYLSSVGVSPNIAYSAVDAFGIQNSAQVTGVQNALQLAEQYGFGGDQTNQLYMTSSFANLKGYQSSLLNSISPQLYRVGLNQIGISNLAPQFGNMSPQTAYMFGQIASGDLQARSYASQWHGGPDADVPMLDMSNRFFDTSGNRNYETSFKDFWSWGQAQAEGGTNAAAIQAFGGTKGQTWRGASTVQDWFSDQGLEVSGEDAAAWAEGGERGRTLLHNQKMYEYQMAGIGIGYAQIAEQKRYLWGADRGGTWDNPAEGSAWGLQDEMRQMEYSERMYQFGYQKQMMETQNYFAGQQEQLSYGRMMTSQNYQRWQMSFERTGSLMQRGWTREDWQYEDTMTQLQFGWEMEDINENLRYAKGRDRKQLLKQRERAVTTQNLQEGQTDKVRDRQEEMWAREDERYQKQTQYAEQMMQYDKEQFELSRKQRLTLYQMEKENLSHSVEAYKKQFALQTEIITAEREHQAKSLELQEAALGVQAAAAEEAKNYADQMATTGNVYKDITGEFELWQKYDPTAILQTFTDMGVKMDSISPERMYAVTNMFSTLNAGTTSYPNLIIDMVNALNSLSPTKMQQLQSILDDLGNDYP